MIHVKDMKTDHTNNGDLTDGFETIDDNKEMFLGVQRDGYFAGIDRIFKNTENVFRKARGVPKSEITTDVDTTDKKSINSENEVIFKERGIVFRFIKI